MIKNVRWGSRNCKIPWSRLNRRKILNYEKMDILMRPSLRTGCFQKREI